MPQPTNKIAEMVEVLREVQHNLDPELTIKEYEKLSQALSFFIRLGNMLATLGEVEKVIEHWISNYGNPAIQEIARLEIPDLAQALLTELTKEDTQNG